MDGSVTAVQRGAKEVEVYQGSGGGGSVEDNVWADCHTYCLSCYHCRVHCSYHCDGRS